MIDILYYNSSNGRSVVECISFLMMFYEGNDIPPPINDEQHAGLVWLWICASETLPSNSPLKIKFCSFLDEKFKQNKIILEKL